MCPCSLPTLTTLSCHLTTEWCLSALAWSPCSSTKGCQAVQDQTSSSLQFLRQALGKWLRSVAFCSAEPGPPHTNFHGKLWKGAELKNPLLCCQSWCSPSPASPEHFSDRRLPFPSPCALPAHCCHYQKSRKFCWRCPETVRGWETGLNVLTVVFSLWRAATCSGFAGYVFFSYKICLAEVEGSIQLSRIPGCPAAGLGVAIVRLWEILDLPHTQGWTLEHTRDPGRLEPARCFYNNYRVCADQLHSTHTGCFLETPHSLHQ